MTDSFLDWLLAHAQQQLSKHGHYGGFESEVDWINSLSNFELVNYFDIFNNELKEEACKPKT